ncbi:MAG TPA: cobalamin biosynthesis protein CbiX [Chromatiales bacterium]|nr:cobalamin biosynthesis protein CbiX [Thiotrichales bacterium]HIP67795.1 cobalamin biosynthesis protein CbiX [Chromatiales bacterium]
MLEDVKKDVSEKILSNSKVSEIKTAFMEYTEPSIATQMKAFDKAGFDEVIIVPLFLTVSSHSLDDIPTIVGMKSDHRIAEQLEKEKIEVYRSKARVTITPTLDFTTLLKKNTLRRIQALVDNTDNTGAVLVAYGDKNYNQQWEEMMDEIGRYLKVKANLETVAYAWCGHLVEYFTEPTIKAVEKVLELEDKVVVVPLLVAYDPYFQDDIIGKATQTVGDSENVIYKPDAILPDNNLNKWVVDIVGKTLEQIS